MKSPLSAQNVSEFLARAEEIRKRHFDADDPWGPWFRGHQQAHWALCPKLYREYGGYAGVRRKDIEDEIREEFIVRAPILSETKPSSNDERERDWEWYFLMQHFGTPTRLLDWTEGSLIGLYFAVKDNPGFYDAAVWVLDPYALNERKEALEKPEIIPPSAGVIPRDRDRVNPWLPERFTKMAGLPEVPLAVYPIHTARRISTQHSCFTIHGTDERGLDKLASEKNGCLEKIVIPAFRVQAVRLELESCGIDEATIFPDLDGLSRTIRARWRPRGHKPPHRGVYTRLRPSRIHGVGVFAIRKISQNTRLFLGDNEEILWVDESSLPKGPSEIRKLYDDFAVIEQRRYGCPPNFNRLTMSWYLNEPKVGERPNVGCDSDTYDFFALKAINPGEELTVDYSTYSNLPESGRKKKTGKKQKNRG